MVHFTTASEVATCNHGLSELGDVDFKGFHLELASSVHRNWIRIYHHGEGWRWFGEPVGNIWESVDHVNLVLNCIVLCWSCVSLNTEASITRAMLTFPIDQRWASLTWSPVPVGIGVSAFCMGPISRRFLGGRTSFDWIKPWFMCVCVSAYSYMLSNMKPRTSALEYMVRWWSMLLYASRPGSIATKSPHLHDRFPWSASPRKAGWSYRTFGV